MGCNSSLGGLKKNVQNHTTEAKSTQFFAPYMGQASETMDHAFSIMQHQFVLWCVPFELGSQNF